MVITHLIAIAHTWGSVLPGRINPLYFYTLKRPPQGVFFYIGKCKSITAPVFSKWARIYSVYIGGGSLCVASVGIYTKIGVYIYGNGGCRASGFLPLDWVYDRLLLHTTACCKLTGFQQLFFKGGIGYAGKFSITSQRKLI